MTNPDIVPVVQQLSESLETDFSITENATGHYILHSDHLAFDILLQSGSADIALGDQKNRYIRIDLDQLLQEPRKTFLRLRALAGKAKRVYARDTVLARIDKKVAMEFQEEHHLQIALPGKYRYGLFHQGELLTVALFSGGRHMRDQAADYRSFELLRFCHKGDTLVVGGISKLIKGFLKDFQANDIMTYVDKDWSQQSSLEAIGFVPVAERAGQEFWSSDGRLYEIKSEEDLQDLVLRYPNGHFKRHSGSIKLILSI